MWFCEGLVLIWIFEVVLCVCVWGGVTSHNAGSSLLLVCVVCCLQLPSNLKVVWNKRLTTTAGFCCYGRDAVTEARKAEIQLSNKVVDSYGKWKEEWRVAGGIWK